MLDPAAHRLNVGGRVGATFDLSLGAPLLVVVPGYAGVRSPKWLHTVTVQDTPSANPIQADDYKLFPPT